MRFPLRLKLSLISLLLLLIPLIGFRFSEALTRDLVASRKESLEFSARAVASALAGRSGLFDQELFHSLNKSRDLYLFELTSPIRLNGKSDDWQPQLAEAEVFGREHILSITEPFDPDSLNFRHLLGIRDDYIYAIFLVTDDAVVYRPADSLAVTRADHLQVGIEDQTGTLHRYIVSTDKEGWVNGFQMPDNPDRSLPIVLETRIQGVWAETDDGYVIEMRFPKNMIGDKFAFALADVDDEQERGIKTIIGTATQENPEKLGWLLSPSQVIEEILHALDRPQSRILIVDSNQRIRASYGSLASEEEVVGDAGKIGEMLSSKIYNLLEPVYRLFTTSFASDFQTPAPLPTTLDISGVQEALQGKSTITSYRIADGQVEVMAAIAPLTEHNKIVGAVVVEQTTNSILALQNRVIEESLTFTILAFVVAAFSLLLFASRLSSRIRRLRDQATRAIGKSGQIESPFAPISARDEIGDLSRSLADMLQQLKEQSDYRETMADNLEHEMRTPLAGISASLKNIHKELVDPSDRISDYLQWAMTDAARLESLLSAIRDAASLQDALRRDTHEDFDLARALQVWLHHSWQAAFPETAFVYVQPEYPCMLHGDPGRIRQLLDKLIENAESFHTPDTPIEIGLSRTERELILTVTNQGPTIPDEMLGQIFNTMVSRRQSPDSRPHLGLGLYVVRTITQHHGGTISVENIAGPTHGVRFTLSLPAA